MNKTITLACGNAQRKGKTLATLIYIKDTKLKFR